MRAASVRYVILTAALASLPVRAAAQAEGAEQIETVRSEARGHIGPIYFTPAVVVKEFGVDSNVFNTAGEQKSDFTVSVGPKVDLWMPIARRALVQGTAASDLVWYARYDSERSIDPQFTGRAEVYLRRVTLFGHAGYVNTRRRLNHEVDLRARHVRSDAGAGVALRLTPKFSIEAARRVQDTRFDADARFDGVSLQRTLNQQTTGFSLAGRHRLTPLTTLVVQYERLQDEFAFSPGRDSSSFRVMPGVEFKPRALISGTARVGYRRFTPTTAGMLPDFSGVVAELGLSYTMLGATTFGVSYSRDLTYSYEEQQPFFVNNSVGASVRRALGPRFGVRLGADRYHYEYRSLAAFGADAAAPRQDVTWNYAGSLGYRIGRGRIGFGVAYWRRDSRVKSFRDYDNLRFGTTLTFGL